MIKYDKIKYQIHKKGKETAASKLLQTMLANLQQLRIAQKFSSQHEIDHLRVSSSLLQGMWCNWSQNSDPAAKFWSRV